MNAPVASALAPTGTLRVAVWTVPYFAVTHGGALTGLIPDLASELARRIDVPASLRAFANPAAIVEAFRDGELDATFMGITADRAAAIDFGPVMLHIETTYLVPAASPLARIGDVDRAGVRIAVPANSAQQAHLAKTLAQATLVAVPPEEPRRALDLLASGAADAFSHVAPMLASVRDALPGARVLPGSYFNVPVAVGIARGRATIAADFARRFAQDMTRSGFARQAIARAGVAGVVAAPAAGATALR